MSRALTSLTLRLQTATISARAVRIGPICRCGHHDVHEAPLDPNILQSNDQIFTAAAMIVYSNTNIAILPCSFFESAISPTIFTLPTRGLGRHTKRGSSCIVASVCWGALFPFLTGLAADFEEYYIVIVVPLAGLLVAFAFLIYLYGLCKGARRVLPRRRLDAQILMGWLAMRRMRNGGCR